MPINFIFKLHLLNKGLKFIPPPIQPPIEDICVDVMASVRRENDEVKQFIETNATIVKRETRKRPYVGDKRANDIHELLKSLRKKNVVFTKADKSNNIVVLDIEQYEHIVIKTRSQGPYVELETDPLCEMVDEVDAVLDKHKNVLCSNPRYELRRWKASNHQVP